MVAAPDAQSFALAMNIAACYLGITAGAALGGGIVATYGVRMIGLGTASVCSVVLLLAFFSTGSAHNRVSAAPRC